MRFENLEKIIYISGSRIFLHFGKDIFRTLAYLEIETYSEPCLTYLNNKIATGFESGLFTGIILIDLQKGFDTINHDILI